MTAPVQFYGIGVGPGRGGLIPIAAVQALNHSHIIFAPRAKRSQDSTARQCIEELGLPEDKFREVVYSMDTDRTQARQVYSLLAQDIAKEVRAGKTVSYLTIGDTMTFSTYGYLLEELRRVLPDLSYRTIAGISSFAMLAAAVGWPLGQSKERILILPCPDTAEELLSLLRQNDLVVLMKIGERMEMVANAINNSPFECAIGQRLGLADELISTDLDEFLRLGGRGYLTTMLIRRKPEEQS